jgi:hypothetical protein
MCKCGLGFSLLDPGQSLVGMCVCLFIKKYTLTVSLLVLLGNKNGASSF